MFCGGQFEFLMYARSASSRSGTEIYGNRSEPPRSSKKMTSHFIILGEQSAPPRICESQTS